ARDCDGVAAGSCPAANGSPCAAHLACLDATSCRTGNCALATDCAGGYCCKTGACVDDTQVTSCGAGCVDCSAALAGDRCVAGACGGISDADCGGTRPECDVAVHQCVQCVTDDQCSSGAPRCKGNVCSGCKNMNDCNSTPFGGTCNMGSGACV